MNAQEIVGAFVNVRRSLIDRGFCQDAVEHAIARVGLRLRDSGMGKVKQTRRLERDLKPYLPPRIIPAGERCTVIPNYPGQENAYREAVARYESQGFTVVSASPFPGHGVTYACPPGELPRENQPLIFQEAF